MKSTGSATTGEVAISLRMLWFMAAWLLVQNMLGFPIPFNQAYAGRQDLD